MSSTRFGVVLLCLLVLFSMIGMLIIQQNVNGFDSYFASLTPAEKLVYGTLGFFNVYYSWYFQALLLILSLNIVLASIDRFPSAWSYIVKPKLWATKKWLEAQQQHASLSLDADNTTAAAAKIAEAFKAAGLQTQVSEKFGSTYVFGEKGKYNRLGPYIVHVCLLTLFLGHFIALRTGFDADVRMMPGDRTDQIQLIQFNLDKKEKYNVQLPYTLSCTDIQQRLIDPSGGIGIDNTMDWRTQIKIEDPAYGVTVADVSLNRPFEYRGYRFFQAQTVPIGNARTITLDLVPQNGGETLEVNIPRLGTAELADGTKIEYDDFQPDFVFNSEGKPDTKSGDYNNPVAILNVTPPGGQRTRVFAFGGNMSDKIPVGAPKLGYKWRLKAFEKAPFAHVLSVKFDPYNAAFVAWYFGGIGLLFALVFVFFFSHKRVWALIEPAADGKFEVTVGGTANRNAEKFEDKFREVIVRIVGEKPALQP